MSRFVVLEHDVPFVHWDFMLENSGSLSTWRLLSQPVPQKNTHGEPIRSVAEQLSEHRLAYLDYEGEVSRNRGRVCRWDAGHFVLLSQSETQWEMRLEGDRLRGFASLLRKRSPFYTKGHSSSETSSDHTSLWNFLLIPDAPEEEISGL